MLGVVKLESSLAEKDLGILVDNKLNISQLYVLAAKTDKNILGYIRRDDGSRWREVILPLSTGETPVVCLVLALWYIKVMDILDKVQRKAKKMMKGLERWGYSSWRRES